MKNKRFYLLAIYLFTSFCYTQNLKKIETILPFTTQFDSINVIEKDGKYYFNEDIIVKKINKPVYYDDVFGNNIDIIEQAVATSDKNRLWELGYIPYQISNSMPAHKVEEIKKAIKTLNAETNLTIRPVNYESDYIYLRYNGDGGCNSYVGKIGGRQTINVAEWCKTGSIMHEFMHAIGFYHEQSRPDRDKYIRVNWNNISSDWRGQYQKVIYSQTIGEYDYNSIMHYPKIRGNFDCYYPCENVGNRERLSQKDIIGINTLYPYTKNKPIEKNDDVPIYFYTELGNDQVIENVIVKVKNLTTEFSVSFKDDYEQSYIKLQEGKKYYYEVFVECIEFKKGSGGYELTRRNGKGKGNFIAKRGKKFSLVSNRRSTSGNYTALFE